VFAFETYENLNQFISFVKDVVPENAAEETYIGGGSLLEAYARVFIWGDFQESYKPPIDRRLSQKTALFTIKLIKSGALTRLKDEEKYPLEFEYIRPASYFLLHKFFFRTQKGYIGLGPKSMQPGDHVCIILGCQQPLILRLDKESNHCVVGSSYL